MKVVLILNIFLSEREGVIVGLDQGRPRGEDPQVGGGQEQRRLLNGTLGTNSKVNILLIIFMLRHRFDS